jgi:hypothetical protein
VKRLLTRLAAALTKRAATPRPGVSPGSGLHAEVTPAASAPPARRLIFDPYETVHGPIFDACIALVRQGQIALLGHPISAEQDLPAIEGLRAAGRLQLFENGAICWSPATRAHAIYGAIWDKWKAMGREQGFLGYPTSDEHEWNGGQRVDFQGGYIFWTAQRGAVVVRG